MIIIFFSPYPVANEIVSLNPMQSVNIKFLFWVIVMVWVWSSGIFDIT
jgi:hypothetical protein